MSRLVRWSVPVLMTAMALALGAWWRAGSTQVVRAPLSPFAVSRASSLRLAGAGGELRYERRGDAWRQVAPFEQPADVAAVRVLLAAASDAAPVYRVPLAEAPPESRLASADLTLTVGVPGEPDRVFRIGADHPAGLAWVAEQGGAQAGPCAPDLRRLSMAAARGALRDDRLLELAGADTDLVAFAVPGMGASEQLRLERGPSGWRMTRPFDSRVDAAAVTAFLQSLARLRHGGVVNENPGDGAAHGLAQPVVELSVRSLDPALGRAREERVLVGGEAGAGGRFVRQAGRAPVLALDAKAVAALLPAPSSFVDPRACGLRPEEISTVRVLDTEDHPRVQLRRDADGWKRLDASGAGIPVDDRNARELLRSLCETRATAIAGDLPRSEWLMGVIELSAGEGVTRRVSAWRLPDGRWAMTDGDGPPRVFAAGLAMPMQPDDHPPKR